MVLSLLYDEPTQVSVPGRGRSSTTGRDAAGLSNGDDDRRSLATECPRASVSKTLPSRELLDRALAVHVPGIAGLTASDLGGTVQGCALTLAAVDE